MIHKIIFVILLKYSLLISLPAFSMERVIPTNEGAEHIQNTSESERKVTFIKFGETNSFWFRLESEQAVNALYVEPENQNLNLSNDDMQFITTALPPEITHLSMKNLNINSNGYIHVSNYLNKNKMLKYLSLENTGISNAAVKFLGDAIVNHKTLQHLNLATARLGRLGASTIGKIITGNKSLKTIDLSYCYIEPAGIDAIAEALGENDTLLRKRCQSTTVNTLYRHELNMTDH